MHRQILPLIWLRRRIGFSARAAQISAVEFVDVQAHMRSQLGFEEEGAACSVPYFWRLKTKTQNVKNLTDDIDFSQKT